MKQSGLYFIIEEGQFNQGDFSKALMMIELAAEVGADAIEFQLAYADDFYIKSHHGYELYKNREFSDSELAELVDYSHKCGIEFVATCLSHRLIEKMISFGADCFNINASDINNPAIVDRIAQSNLPFFVSMPLATVSEICWVIERIKSINDKAEYRLLHGQHPMASGKDYVETVDTALGFINEASKTYGKAVGFIDHTPHFWMPSVAVAAGAEIITKHLTPSHIYKGPDFSICCNPEEMKTAITMAKECYQSRKVADKKLAPGEDELDKAVMRRSIVAAKDLPEGATIKYEDILFKRPGTGISPNNFKDIVGRTVKQSILQDTLIDFSMLV
jgi:sialic acid synthase SpsE